MEGREKKKGSCMSKSKIWHALYTCTTIIIDSDEFGDYQTFLKAPDENGNMYL